jgi:beta-galactosidase
MVHILPHWNFRGFEGQQIKVDVYTNCPEVELFVNGKSLGRKKIEKYGKGVWEAVYTPGEIKAVAYGEKGEELCTSVKRTTGEPVALKLVSVCDYEANGKDIALFDCFCVDKDGNTVPDAAKTVTFTVSAPATVVGSGSDNTDHTPVTSPVRKMYMGVIRVAVKPAKNTPFVLSAICDGCGAAQIKG